MKKYIPFLLFPLFLLSTISCKDDKDPIPSVIPKKLNKVTISKNNESPESFVITYKQTEEIANIKFSNQHIDYFTYSGNTIIVNSISTSYNVELTDLKKVTYQTSGNTITREEESLYNSYLNNEEYISNIYTYQYTKNSLGKTVWELARWPLEDGSYQTTPRTDLGEFIWEGQNITRYRYLPKSIMEFEFSEDLQPSNFPLKIYRTLEPTDFETFSPLNLLMGGLNKNLIKRAYWYNVPDATNICAEYLFDYSYGSSAENITGLTITEKIYPAGGKTTEENKYTYTFEYQ